MINETMLAYNITNYRYDIQTKTLYIYQSLSVETYLLLKSDLPKEIENIIIKKHRR